ncbi:NAD(P)/FAD-dependent oxidoreductase [Sphingobacteriales bacterium UPWRP_1]|nr:4-hydroxyacetophenone monooxygenase [Sphingobacteriales bacterium TSM_CSM]PSJ71764.1 NAD(P)/FAD-dependent oxidoreductase [Sphingobacteriales bacterium UPWRP_1]
MQNQHYIGIIGAGFGGLTAALRLQKEGLSDFIIFERADDLGGTWRDNIYPGCACDVPSHLYSFKDEPNPNWTNVFAGQAEIWQYMKQVIQNHRLQPHIQYNTNITKAVYRQETGTWLLTDQNGKEYVVKMVISATGPLNRPNIPPIKGLANFKGNWFHSSQWNNQCNWNGKKVAVIGTGASAIQIVPQLAPSALQLTVFQRSAAWIMPRRNRRYTQIEKTLFHYLPFLQTLNRERIYWVAELLGNNFTGNKLLNRLATMQALYKLKKEVKDPETRKKLTPNYTIGCKRILLSDDYLPAFNHPNVQLVTDSIDHIAENGVVTKNGQLYEADFIIFGTGFHAADTADFEVSITGLNGRNLIEEWRNRGVEAYKGTTISGFPNFALILGPNTGLGHNSVLHMMDSQMNYIMDYLHLLQKQTANAGLNVKPDAQELYNQKLQNMFAGTVWASGCKSWYLDDSGKNTTLYPRLTVNYRKATLHINAADYQVV